MAYDVSRLKLEGIRIQKLNDCRISQETGGHGELFLHAYIEEDVFEELESLQPIRLYVSGKQEQTIFCGVLTDFIEKSVGGFKEIWLEAKSYTYLMDIKKRSRTFQDITMTYMQLLASVLNEYGDVDFIAAIQDRPIGELAVQYQETDWNFLKRIFSRIYSPLTGEMRFPAIRVYAGVPMREEEIESYELKEVTHDLERCAALREWGYEIRDVDGIRCRIKTGQSCGIFSSCQMHGSMMVAESLHGYLEQGLFWTEAVLGRKEGIVEMPRFPMDLVGLALEGTVLDVQGEHVRLHFSIDGEQESDDCYWFPYSTPSSSPDGSGWYYMPEIGDRLRVYFPTKQMRDVLAISAVSSYEGKDGPDRMADTSTKYLRSASGQEMNLSDQGAYFASADEMASMMVGNDGKISIKGQQIEITAKESIDVMEAQEVTFHSKTGAVYQCSQGGKLELESGGNLKISGSKLNID